MCTVRTINYIALPLIVLAAWWLVTARGVFPSVILPSIPSVALSFVDQIRTGQLFGDLGVSLLRVVKGYLIAAVAGVSVGILMGISIRSYRFFIVTFNSIRQIPIISWIPLIIMWFGIGEASKVVIIVMGAFFPILLNTINGIAQTPQDLIEVGQMNRLSKWELLKNIYIPSSLPSIFVGLRLGLGLSWMVVVGAEMLGSESGIGYRINDARSLMEPNVVIVGMFAIAIVGYVLDHLLNLLLKRLTPWANDDI